MFFVVCLTLLVIVLVRIYWQWIRPSKKIHDHLRRQGVSCEPFIPLIGQMPIIRRYREQGRLLEYHQELTKKHGLMYLFNLGPHPRLVIQEAEYLPEILGRNQDENYSKPNDLGFRLKPLIGLHNLLVSNGVEHERARKMLNPAFHYVKLQSMISIMTDKTAKAIDSLLDSSSNGPIDLSIYFNTLTLSIIASSAFGGSCEIVSLAFTDVLSAISYRASRLINLIPLIRSLPLWQKEIVDCGTRQMNEFVDKIIHDRRQGRSESLCAGDDLLDLLLSAVDADGHAFTDEEIKDQALTFVLAGHETTSNLMCWCLFILMENPSIFDDCREEVDRILPDGIRPSSENCNEFVVLEAVINETLRLYPPAPFILRQSLRDQTIGKTHHRPLDIPQGTIVLINSYAIHRRDVYWPHAEQFDYKRWLRDVQTGFKPKLSHPFCYLPFAAGARNCIGQNFALLEAKVMLAMLIQRCEFRLEPGQEILPEIRITMKPKNGLFARVSRRRL